MRAQQNLRERYKTILHYTGLVLVLGSLLMFIPLVVSTKADRTGFILPGMCLFLVGAVFWLSFRRKDAAVLTVQEGGIIVLLSWVLICLFSAWPFVAIHGLGPTQAIFESVSGWTTTGLSVIDVTKASSAILLWRSIMQLAGGAGLAIIVLATIVGPIGPAVSIAEGRSEQLAPHVRESAKLVMFLYCGYAVAGVVAYVLAGMNWFDAVNHTFTAISTGGFSTKTASIGHWDSVAVEAVTIPLMLLGNLNFFTAYLLLHGRFRAVSRNGELRLIAVLAPLAMLILFLSVCIDQYPALSKGVRVTVFETLTALTTTGFSTVAYNDWSSEGWLLLIVLMLVGGGAGSTAGGIKQYRIFVLFKSVVWEIRRALLPRTAVAQNYLWQGEAKDFITEERIRRVGTFMFLYLTMYVIGAGIIAAYGYPLRESLFEYASALGTVGLSVGITGPQTPAGILWAEIVGMFLGRLEFFVVLVSLIVITRDLTVLIPGRRSKA